MSYENVDGQCTINSSQDDGQIAFVDDGDDNYSDEAQSERTNNSSVVVNIDENVELWVQEKTNKDCIQFFKPQYCMSPKYPELGLDGYFLLLMTKPQIEFMKNFSERLVCIDRQSGENFEIVTLLVLDNREECMPCAFLFANKVTLEVFKVFFTEIKNIVGKVETKLILTEKMNMVSCVWDQVMETSVKNMTCSWDVLKDWTLNLCSVEPKEKIDETFKELQQLLEEKDINCFSSKYANLLTKLINDPETEEFAQYFLQNYAHDPQTWACSYRYEEEDSRGYSQLEKVHLTIHYILQSRSSKKLNKALDATLDFLRNKIYDRLILINNGKVSSKLAEIRHKHKIAEKMVYQIAKHGEIWSVISRKREHNIVTLCKFSCNCQSKCSVCNVCVHTYECTCVDSVLKLNMCRHIHSVCISEAAGTTVKSKDPLPSKSMKLSPNLAILPLKHNLKVNKNRSFQKIYTKKSSELNQLSKPNKRTKLFYYKAIPEENMNLLKGSEQNKVYIKENAFRVAEESVNENFQIFQSDHLEIVEQEVLVANHEESDIIYKMENEGEETDESDVCLQLFPNKKISTHSSVNGHKIIESRKTNVERMFKTILSGVHDEEQLIKVENAVEMLQNDMMLSSPSGTYFRKRECLESQTMTKTPKMAKILSADGMPIGLGKAVILQFAK